MDAAAASINVESGVKRESMMRAQGRMEPLGLKELRREACDNDNEARAPSTTNRNIGTGADIGSGSSEIITRDNQEYFGGRARNDGGEHSASTDDSPDLGGMDEVEESVQRGQSVELESGVDRGGAIGASYVLEPLRPREANGGPFPSDYLDLMPLLWPTGEPTALIPRVRSIGR